MILTISLSVSRMPSRPSWADVADGVLDALGDDAVPRQELLAVQVHVIAHDAGLHAGGDLGGTAGLGAVADDARDDGQRVHQGVGDGLIVGPLEIGDAAACRAAALTAPQ